MLQVNAEAILSMKVSRKAAKLSAQPSPTPTVIELDDKTEDLDNKNFNRLLACLTFSSCSSEDSHNLGKVYHEQGYRVEKLRYRSALKLVAVKTVV